MTNLKIRKAVRLALAANVGVAVAAVSPQVFAQSDETLEEVVVTGSRIKKKDFISNAPVATVGSEQIVLTGTINTESLLNTLPQTVPGLDRTSNNPGNGTATVDLRGLGSNRTLVLVNGTRYVPTTSGGSVDINAIPNALIEDIEVLTGGASAVYGSDAVAGVVNFILKEDFEGVAINAGYETTQEGDADILSADITLGANLADGRGNVTLNISVTDRDDLFQGDRDFASTAQTEAEDANGNIILTDGGSSGIPSLTVFSGLGGFSDTGAVTFEPDGSVRPFRTGEVNDYYNYAPVNYIQLPQTRYQMTALGRFEISERAEVYGRAMFTESEVPSQLAPTPIFQSTTFTLDGSPFLPVATQQIISDGIGDGVDTDGNGIDDTATGFVGRRLLEVGPRVSDDSFTSYQLQAGIRGAVTGSWDYDAFAQIGRVTNSSTQLGNVNRGRFDQALLLDLTDPTGNTCADPSNSGATVPCAPINIFGEGNISSEGAAFLETAVAAKATYQQIIVGGNLAGDFGDVLKLPGGSIGAAIGFEHREEDFTFQPSQDLAASTIAGFNGSPAVGGGFDVDEIYGELYLPILSGAPLAEQLDVELAFRASDYTTAGSVDAFKISASWAPFQLLRFRGGFNTANRAPSIGELFSPQGENFPPGVDPCSADGNPDAAVAAICEATGVPAALVGDPSLNVPAGQVRELTGGNPTLKEEEAETFTFGVVVNPLDGLELSLDYFDIQIEDYIFDFGGGANEVLSNCYDPAVGGAGSDFCNVVTRRPAGTIESVSILQQNVAEQTLKGYDLAATYQLPLFGGDFRIRYLGTFTTESLFTPSANDPAIDCLGNFGRFCDDPLPHYKHRVGFNWARNDLTAQLLWRHVGGSRDDARGEPNAVLSLGAEDYFDASVAYSFGDNYSVTFGIDNLLDTDPPILGDNAEQANTYPATYDVFGRTFFLRASSDF